ncbi:MAG: hypothetical protein AAB354_02815, partial [candidate division KSB1 bacterium]
MNAFNFLFSSSKSLRSDAPLAPLKGGITKVLVALFAFFLLFNGSCDDGGGGNPPRNAGQYHTYAEIDSSLHALAGA